MRIAVISDIHGNPAALEKVMADIERRKCDKVVCLGDVVGYGYDPNACVEMCQKKCDVCLMGNHDAAVKGSMSLNWFSQTAREGILRDRKAVRNEFKDWLGRDGYQHVENPIEGFYAAFSHGTFTCPEEFNYIESTFDALTEMAAMDRAKVNCVFVGHTHCAKIFDIGDSNEFERAAKMPHRIDNTKPTIFNVGSVGYPRNQPFSSYAIFEVDEKVGSESVEYVKIDFDFKGYVDELGKAGIDVPMWMSKWEGKYL